MRARHFDIGDFSWDSILAEKIGTQDRAVHTRGSFNRNHAFRGNADPIRNGWLGNTQLTCEFAYTTRGADRSIETFVAHQPP